MHALLFLSGCFGQQIGQVAVQDGLLQAFLARGIDAFADQHRLRAERQRHAVGRDHGLLSNVYSYGFEISYPFCDRGDRFGRRAAAASHDAHAFADRFFHISRERCGRNVIDSLPILQPGQSGVRLKDDRKRRFLQILLRDGKQRVRSQGTVHAHGGDTQSFQHRRHHRGIRAGQQASVLAVSVGGEDGKIRVFLRCQHGRFRLITVAHRLDEDEIRLLGGAGPDKGRERFHGFFEIKIAEGFQQFAAGADVQADPLQLRRRAFRGRCPRVADGSFRYFLKLIRGIPQPAGAERVRDHRVAARVEIRAVDGGHHVRMADIPGLRTFTGLQALRLQKASHASVQDQDIVF